MKKLTLLLSAMLFSMMSFAAVVTFDADTDKGNAGTDSNNATAYTITKDGVTVTVSSGILGTYNNQTHYRIYKNQTLTITSTSNITSVQFTCTANDDAKYGPGCFTVDGGSYTYSGAVGTWTGSATKIVFTASSNQVRATEIVVALDGESIPDNGGGNNGGGTTPPPAEGVITCAQAVEICKATGETSTTETYTIRGYVTEIKTAYDSQYDNVSYWMADEQGGGQVLQAYRVKPIKETDQSVKVNDYVEVVGTLVNYKGNTPEVNAGGTYTIITTGEAPSLPEGLTGDGTKDNPFTIADVMLLNNQFAGPYYVQAYIVGQVNGASMETGAEFEAPFTPSTNSTTGEQYTYNTNLLIAANADETDVTNCVPVQLPAGDLRTNFNLPENPEMDGEEVLICGTLTAYFKAPGIKSTSSIELVNADPNAVNVKGLKYADAYYMDGIYEIFLYNDDENTGEVLVPALSIAITAKNKTSLNGTYKLNDAMYVTKVNELGDAVGGVEMDTAVEANVTIKNVNNEGSYSFKGSFVGTDGKTYVFNQTLDTYAEDENGEVIDLKENNTALGNVTVDKTPTKVLENGQLIIIRGKNVYNVLGTIVK